MHDDVLCDDYNVSTNTHVAGNGQLRLISIFLQEDFLSNGYRMLC